MTQTRSDIRNIAIIAHVDHGKTTLVDGMLKQSKVFRDANNAAAAGERILDSNALEKERGITILAKNTAITWQGTKINIVDTPGHADFGGEVERVLNMVDGVLLLVDAVEGPMPQTRFVLRKALAQNLRVIVVINKVDRAHARPAEVLNETFDLFIELGANDFLADFPVVYAIGLDGKAGMTADGLVDSLEPLFETIVREVPAPTIDADAPPRLLVTTLEYDSYKGQIGVGRLLSGTLRKGQPILRIPVEGPIQKGNIAYLFTYHNLAKQEVDEVRAGDIVAFGGFEHIGISDTIADPAFPEALPPISVEQPTVRMTFGINTSPFTGREGKVGLGTSRKLRERLYNETRSNLALRVQDGDSPEKFVVSGRGELHLGILIETMRREGYEFEVSKPEVIFIVDEDTGETMEPIEEVHIEVADDLTGTVVEMIGGRRGRMMDMNTERGTTFMTYQVPTRGLLGLRSKFLTATGGMGQLHTIFHGYEPYAGGIPGRQFGSLVAYETGKSSTYAFDQVKQRGTFLIEPGTEVYQGMVVGIHIRAEDLAINVCKTKQLSAVHTVYFGKEDKVNVDLNKSLDDYIEFLAEDELLEVTPVALRVRKRILDTEKRQKEQKAKERMAEA
ncbi:MAG: translational GTPase TypA [Chloroflexota bacterium]|nr:translational GTPase TypA [Chloroflexota bacterium]